MVGTVPARCHQARIESWSAVLRERLSEWTELDSQRVELARRSVELPPEFIANRDAREAVLRAASGDRLWPILAVGKSAAKTLVNAIRLDGAPVSEGDVQAWRHVAAVISHNVRRQQITARWRNFAAEVGIPPTDDLSTTLTTARKVIAVADSAQIYDPLLGAVTRGSTGMEQLADDPTSAGNLFSRSGLPLGQYDFPRFVTTLIDLSGFSRVGPIQPLLW